MSKNNFEIKKGINVRDGKFIADENEVTIDGISVVTQDVLDSQLSNGVDDLTQAEVDQLKNINLNTISSIQWGYVGSQDQSITTTDSVVFDSIILNKNGITDNIAIGTNAGNSITTNSSGNVLLGKNAGFGVTTNNNFMAGPDAGYDGAGTGCVFIGYRAGYHFKDGNYNVCLGEYAGYGAGNSASGSQSVFIGFSAGYSITTGEYNIAVGEACGYNITSGNNNIFLGDIAGYNTQDGDDNIAFGRGALYRNVSGFDIIAMGEGAAGNLSGVIGNQSIAIGKQAGYGQTGLSTYSNCIFMGYRSGYLTTTGSDNISIGYQAGDNITTGSGNVCIGKNAKPSSATATNQCIIGGIDGDVLNVGIGGNTNPQEALDVAGSVQVSGDVKTDSIVGRTQYSNLVLNSFDADVEVVDNLYVSSGYIIGPTNSAFNIRAQGTGNLVLSSTGAGIVQVNDDLDVTGNLSLINGNSLQCNYIVGEIGYGNVVIQSTGGDVEINDDLDVVGQLEVNNIVARGVGTTVNINDSLVVSGNLNLINGNSLQCNSIIGESGYGNVTISSTGANVQINDDLDVVGTVTTDTITGRTEYSDLVISSFNANSRVRVNDNLAVTGTLTMQDANTFQCNSIVGESGYGNVIIQSTGANVQINDSLDVVGTLLTDTITARGAGTTVQINDGLDITGTLKVDRIEVTTAVNSDLELAAFGLGAVWAQHPRMAIGGNTGGSGGNGTMYAASLDSTGYYTGGANDMTITAGTSNNITATCLNFNVALSSGDFNVNRVTAYTTNFDLELSGNGTGDVVVKTGFDLLVEDNLDVTGTITGREPWIFITGTASSSGVDDFTAVANKKYMIDSNLRTGGVIVMTLPTLTTEVGTTVTVTDMKGDFAVGGVKNVETNSTTINGSTQTWEFDVPNSTTVLVWTGATYGWKTIITQP